MTPNAASEIVQAAIDQLKSLEAPEGKVINESERSVVVSHLEHAQFSAMKMLQDAPAPDEG